MSPPPGPHVCHVGDMTLDMAHKGDVPVTSGKELAVLRFLRQAVCCLAPTAADTQSPGHSPAFTSVRSTAEQTVALNFKTLPEPIKSSFCNELGVTWHSGSTARATTCDSLYRAPPSDGRASPMPQPCVLQQFVPADLSKQDFSDTIALEQVLLHSSARPAQPVPFTLRDNPGVTQEHLYVPQHMHTNAKPHHAATQLQSQAPTDHSTSLLGPANTSLDSSAAHSTAEPEAATPRAQVYHPEGSLAAMVSGIGVGSSQLVPPLTSSALLQMVQAVTDARMSCSAPLQRSGRRMQLSHAGSWHGSLGSKRRSSAVVPLTPAQEASMQQAQRVRRRSVHVLSTASPSVPLPSRDMLPRMRVGGSGHLLAASDSSTFMYPAASLSQPSSALIAASLSVGRRSFRPEDAMQNASAHGFSTSLTKTNSVGCDRNNSSCVITGAGTGRPNISDPAAGQCPTIPKISSKLHLVDYEGFCTVQEDPPSPFSNSQGVDDMQAGTSNVMYCHPLMEKLWREHQGNSKSGNGSQKYSSFPRVQSLSRIAPQPRMAAAPGMSRTASCGVLPATDISIAAACDMIRTSAHVQCRSSWVVHTPVESCLSSPMHADSGRNSPAPVPDAHLNPIQEPPGGSQDPVMLSLKDYQPLKLLSRGYAAEVHQAYCCVTGRMCVLKTYHLDKLDAMTERHMYREIAILADTTAAAVPGVVQLWAVFKEDEHVVLVLELCAGGDLHSILARHGGQLSEECTVHKVLHPLLTTLQALHAAGVVHRDVKLKNICFTLKGELRLCDLGLAIDTRLETPMSHIGTPGYMAPELLEGDRLPQDTSYDGGSHPKPRAAATTDPVTPHATPRPTASPPAAAAADIWSLGVTVFLLMTGRRPYQDDFLRELVLAGEDLPALDFGSSPPLPVDAQHFLTVTLKQDPWDRPSATDLLQHPWVLRHMAHAGQ